MLVRWSRVLGFKYTLILLLVKSVCWIVPCGKLQSVSLIGDTRFISAAVLDALVRILAQHTLVDTYVYRQQAKEYIELLVGSLITNQ